MKGNPALLGLAAPAAATTEASPPLWTPNAGPQSDAYTNQAHELFWGGSAGGGKSDLLLGLALTQHQRAIIYRREFTQLTHLAERSREIIRDGGRFNEQKFIWRLKNGKTLEFGAVQLATDVSKYQGRPHDFCGFDEISNFLLSQYLFLSGWLRTADPHQRTRIVAAGNPPTAAEGEWVIERWAAWIDPQSDDPALPGELRWFVRLDGEDKQVENGLPFEWKNETVQPKSRTFIPARVDDNPFYMATGYKAQLQALPEPLRSQMLYGDFTVGSDDNQYQVIPTAWVRAAFDRWDQAPKRPSGPMTAVGVDVARGGKDRTVLACRWGNWYSPLDKYPGTETPDGDHVAALVLKALLNGGHCYIDTIGVGASPYDRLKKMAPGRVHGVNFSEGARDALGRKLKDRTGQIEFRNWRAYAYWRFREMLDPQSGEDLALPPDNRLLADLTAPRWEMSLGGLLVESKEDIQKRLGRSPDDGDAVVLASMQPRRKAFGTAVGVESTRQMANTYKPR